MRAGVGVARARFVPLLALLLAGCEIGGIVDLGTPQAGDQVLPEPLTLLVWNAQKLHEPRIAEDLLALVDRHRPDLVLLQEASPQRLHDLPIAGHFANGWAYPWPGGDTIGVMTLAHAAPQRIEPVRSAGREFKVTAPKVSLATVHPLADGQRLLVLNVHLLAFETGDPAMLRAQLDDLDAILSRHPGPVIMGGDFNTWNRKRLALVRRLTCAHRLEEVTDPLHGRTTGDLHVGFLNRWIGVDTELPLDRVYARGFRAVSAAALAQDSSDHQPIVATLARQPRARPGDREPVGCEALRLPS